MKKLVRYKDPNEFLTIYLNFPGQHVPKKE